MSLLLMSLLLAAAFFPASAPAYWHRCFSLRLAAAAVAICRPSSPETETTQRTRAMSAELIRTFLDAKEAEEAAREARIDAETALLAALPEGKSEGSVTIREGVYRITITRGWNRRIDSTVLEQVRSSIPVALLEQAIRWRPEANVAGLRYLQNNEPQVYAALAEAIIATPAKPFVRVDVLAPIPATA